LDDLASYCKLTCRSKYGHDFKNKSAELNVDSWPTPLFYLFEGTSSVGKIFAAAKGSDQRTQRDNICNADFYVGEWYLLQQRRDDASKLFNSAMNDCVPTDLEFGATAAELKSNNNK
jgi:lipoprotein NlpI